MANVFDEYQVIYLPANAPGDWDNAPVIENAMHPPRIGEGVVLSVDGAAHAYRIVDVWTVYPKHGGVEYGVYAVIEEVEFNETPLVGWDSSYYSG